MRKLFYILILALTSTLAYAQRPDQIELPCPAGRPATTPVPVRLLVLLAVRLRLFREQRLAVGDGDLIIVRMDFREGQKSMPVSAVVNEGGLQRRFEAGDLRQIDISAKRFLVG